jgi:hypothetical protein
MLTHNDLMILFTDVLRTLTTDEIRPLVHARVTVPALLRRYDELVAGKISRDTLIVVSASVLVRQRMLELKTAFERPTVARDDEPEPPPTSRETPRAMKAAIIVGSLASLLLFASGCTVKVDITTFPTGYDAGSPADAGPAIPHPICCNVNNKNGDNLYCAPTSIVNWSNVFWSNDPSSVAEAVAYANGCNAGQNCSAFTVDDGGTMTQIGTGSCPTSTICQDGPDGGFTLGLPGVGCPFSPNITPF